MEYYCCDCRNACSFENGHSIKHALMVCLKIIVRQKKKNQVKVTRLQEHESACCVKSRTERYFFRQTEERQSSLFRRLIRLISNNKGIVRVGGFFKELHFERNECLRFILTSDLTKIGYITWGLVSFHE
jgi:hypothetical protein